jgi:hypothetical protein
MRPASLNPHMHSTPPQQLQAQVINARNHNANKNAARQSHQPRAPGVAQPPPAQHSPVQAVAPTRNPAPAATVPGAPSVPIHGPGDPTNNLQVRKHLFPFSVTVKHMFLAVRKKARQHRQLDIPGSAGMMRATNTRLRPWRSCGQAPRPWSLEVGSPALALHLPAMILTGTGLDLGSSLAR